ncbi:MAG: hypothetical protein ACOY3Y_18095 [Acidobacteriota bacterium]
MDEKKSRREFVFAGAATAVAFQAAGVADLLAQNPPAARQLGSAAGRQLRLFKLGKNNLGLLSHQLFQSPAERQKFLANPLGYTEGLLGGKLDPLESGKLNDVRQMLAGGFCCQGCGCSGLPGTEFVQPAAGQQR